MGRKITQRELRNNSGEIMRGLDRGESYTVTRNGVPVGELTPVARRTFVPIGDIQDLFTNAPAVDAGAWLRDVRGGSDGSPEPDPWLAAEQRRGSDSDRNGGGDGGR